MTPTQNNILGSVKKAMGVLPDETIFDPEIIIHINSAFFTLNQLGVGPKAGYSIETGDETWKSFLGTDTDLEAVKQYVYAKTRLAFDPPTTSFGISGLETVCKELEWRLNVQVESREE